LSRLGPVTLEVWDPATVDPPDLNRQLLYTPVDLGAKKAEQAERVVAAVNPEVRVHPVGQALTAERFLAHHEQSPDEAFVLFDCLDTMAARAELDAIASARPAPIFHGGVERWYGQVATLLPGGHRYGDLFGSDYSEQRAPGKPILPFVVSTVSSCMVGEFIHWTEDPMQTPLSSRIAYFDGKQMEWRTIGVGSST
jgi:molybdopterin/thiamine biosynthesis adenylyltransferase